MQHAAGSLPRLAYGMAVSVLLALLVFACGGGPAYAQNAVSPLNTAKTTPNLAVTASATAEYDIPGGPVRFIYLKNDCNKALWFSLSGLEIYSLKLATAETFQGYFRVNTIKVSPDNTGTACTFTAIGGR